MKTALTPSFTLFSFFFFFACYGIQLTHFTADVSDGESKPSTEREHTTKVSKQVIELT